MTEKATEKATEKTKPAVSDILPHETSIHVSLAALHVDFDWNVRSYADVTNELADGVQDESKPEGFGLKDLIADMHLNGQDTAVIVAAIKDGKTLGGVKTDRKFELIAGFRRFASVNFLNTAEETAKRVAAGDKTPAVKGVPDGHIVAVVRSFQTLRDARIANARENTLRSNLKAPDLVRLVSELTASNGAKGITQTEVGAIVGINQGYVSKLVKVGQLPKAILAHWRERTAIPGITNIKADWKQLAINEMEELATSTKGLTSGETVDRYVALLNGEVKDKKSRDPNKAVEEKLGEIGYLLGSLVAEGVIQPGTLAWAAVIGPEKGGYQLNSGTKEPTRERKNELVDIIEGQYRRAIEDAAKVKARAESL